MHPSTYLMGHHDPQDVSHYLSSTTPEELNTGVSIYNYSVMGAGNEDRDQPMDTVMEDDSVSVDTVDAVSVHNMGLNDFKARLIEHLIFSGSRIKYSGHQGLDQQSHLQ